jgi:chromosome segregation ATPase
MKNGSATKKAVSLGPRIAVFLAGIAAGAWTLSRKQGARTGQIDLDGLQDLRRSTAELEARVVAQESANAERFLKIESRLDEHDAKLAEVPSTTQIVEAMEQLLTKTMANLDERLTTQARSIEVLKSTVSQTDSVLERILESLDSLQPQDEDATSAEEELLQLTA